MNAERHQLALYAEFCYAECRSAECRGALEHAITKCELCAIVFSKLHSEMTQNAFDSLN
jgi:hypothetical protein